jgi:hypothetical protein
MVPGRDAAGRGRLAGIGVALEENGTLVVVLAMLAVLLLAKLRHSLAADGWMALLSGREIVQHGLPSHDAITVWAHGRRWVDQQWLAQLFLYGLERVGGLRLVLFAHAVLATAGLTAAALLARRRGASARSVTWLMLPVLVAYFPGASVARPQSLTYLLFVALLALLIADEDDPSRRVFLTLPILVLWANLHGSVVLAVAVVSGYGLLALVRGLRRDTRTERVRALVLTLAPVVCVFISPYALDLPAYYREILVSGGFSTYVTEWAPTTLTPITAPFYLLVIGGVWLLGRSRGRVSAFQALLFVGLALLAFEAFRNMVWLALAGIIVLPRLVDELRPAVVEPRALNRLLATAMVVGVVVAAVGVGFKHESWFLSDYPSGAANAVQRAAGASGTVFANEKYADWLVWRHPDLRGRIAFDSRFELLRRSQLKAVANFRNRVEGWHLTTRGYRVVVLDPTEEGKVRDALLAGGAQSAYRDDQVVVLTGS